MNAKQLLLVFSMLGLLLSGWYFLWPRPQPEITVRMSPVDALQGDTEGFLRAEGPREFHFPDDHGPHPGYRTEWWYYTGNLFTEEGRHFAYQFTIFRNQLRPPGQPENSESVPGETTPDKTVYNESLHGTPELIQTTYPSSQPKSTQTTYPSTRTASPNPWQTDQLYLAHMALSDVQNQRHYAAERYSRGAAGLAGAQAQPFRVWLENWVIELDSTVAAQRNSDLPVHIHAQTDPSEGHVALSLSLAPVKPLVKHGDNGFDIKGSQDGNASYYLTFSRMQTSGTLTINGESFEVSGLSWMDHEWSTSVLDDDQEGWDWFSMQLSNGYDLMYYELRDRQGGLSPYSTGTVIDPDGTPRRYAHGDARLESQRYWTSPHTGGRYPVSWVLQMPDEELELQIETLFDDQEMNVSLSYYEGEIGRAHV